MFKKKRKKKRGHWSEIEIISCALLDEMIFQSLLRFLAHTFFPLSFRLSSVCFFSLPSLWFQNDFYSRRSNALGWLWTPFCNRRDVFFIVLLLEGSVSSVLTSPQMEIASAVTKTRRVSVLLWHIHPTSASKVIRETTLENSSMVFSLLPASHCVSTLHDIAMQKPTCACTAYVGLHLIRKKMDQVAQKPGKGQLSPAGSSVLLPLLASWYVPSAFVMLTSCSSQNIGNTFPVSSDPPVSVARCKILSFSRNFVR